jgi:hypothetical protein
MQTSSSTQTWSGALVSEESDPEIRSLVSRGGTGIALAALYGLAAGARHGGESLFLHALGAPAGALAVTLVAVPALFIILTLFDAPIEPRRLAAVAVRAFATFGIVLAGLAPAVALFVVTSGADVTAKFVVFAGLAIAGGLALRSLMAGLWAQLADVDTATSLLARGVLSGFLVLSVMLAARVWVFALPILGGAS